jgi:hypothetical protein
VGYKRVPLSMMLLVHWSMSMIPRLALLNRQADGRRKETDPAASETSGYVAGSALEPESFDCLHDRR